MRFAVVPVSVLDSDHDALFFLTRSFGHGLSSKATVLLSEKLLRSQSREEAVQEPVLGCDPKRHGSLACLSRGLLCLPPAALLGM